jgi:Skp family chaperone for outer membrane proteins
VPGAAGYHPQLKTKHYKHMKKVFTLVLLAAGLFVATPKTQAQIKIGYISLGDVIQAMPEAKKADSSLVQFRDALYQNEEVQH